MQEDLPDYIREDVEAGGERALALPDDAKIKKGSALAAELANLEYLIDSAEARVKEWKKRRQELARKEIPEFFRAELHTDKIGVPEREVDVVVEDYYHANIAADWEPERREKAFRYLEKEGHGDTIGVVVTVKFTRGELPKARALEQLIKRSPTGNTHPPVLEMAVPWATLTALVKSETKAGRKIDLDTLGATVGRQANVKKRR